MKDWLRAHGMTFGNVVSAQASGKGFSEEELAALGADVDEPVDAPDRAGDRRGRDRRGAETDDTEVAATTEDRGSRGNGNGNGSGNGNGGKGNGKN